MRIGGKIASTANITTCKNFVPRCSLIVFMLFNGQTEHNLNISGSYAAIAGKLAVLQTTVKKRSDALFQNDCVQSNTVLSLSEALWIGFHTE